MVGKWDGKRWPCGLLSSNGTAGTKARPAVQCRSHRRPPPAGTCLVTDVGLQHISRLMGLECLDLFAARISDAGCVTLRWGGGTGRQAVGPLPLPLESIPHLQL